MNNKRVLNRWVWYTLSSAIIVVGNFILIPFTTSKLEPRDFGYYGLITSFTVVGANLAAFGFNFVLSKHSKVTDLESKKLTVSTLFWFGLAITIIFGILLISFWSLISSYFSDVKSIPVKFVYLAIITNIISYPGILLFEYMRINGDSSKWSILTVVQFLVNSFVTIILLYYYDFSTSALFLGSLAGSIVSLTFSIFLLRNLITFSYSKQDLGYLLTLGKMSILGSTAENFYNVFERLSIIKILGDTKLGLFIHSISYRQIGMTIASTFSNSIWPETLIEAGQENPEFKKTNLFWFIVYLLLGIGGIIFAFFGTEIIDLLTNGKFTNAAILVPFWFIFLLIQHSGRADIGIIFSKGHGAKYLKFNLFRIIICLASLILFINRFGLIGVLISSISSMIVFRGLIYFHGQKLYKKNSVDIVVFVWSCLIIFSTIINLNLILSIQYKLIFFFTEFTLFYFIFKSYFENIYRVFLVQYKSFNNLNK